MARRAKMVPLLNVIQYTHESHLGISSTKRCLREQHWWPGVDLRVDKWVRSCDLSAGSDKSNKAYGDGIYTCEIA